MARALFWNLLAITLFGFFASSAAAESLIVSPVRVVLDAGQKSSSVTVRNDKHEPQSLQVSAYVWGETEQGQMTLAPTTDIVFYPGMLTLRPGEARTIRIATTRTTKDTELSYRVFVEELPPPPSAASLVRVLTRFGIPVFVEPGSIAPKPRVGMQLDAGSVHIAIENPGNAHFIARTLHVIGESASGDVVVDEKVAGWYVLAHGRRVYDLALSADACRRLSTLKADVTTEAQGARSTYPVDVRACAR